MNRARSVLADTVFGRYAVAAGAGLLAGCVYWLLGVPSPAPPWIGLCGLLGILLGERIGSSVHRRLSRLRGSTSSPPT